MTELSRAAQLNIQKLITFRSVFELGGYAPVAAQSGLSVATVWQHIRALEEAYGVQLFRKVGRRVESTVEAARLYESIDGILVSLDSTFDIVDASAAHHAPIRIVSGNRMLLEDLAEPIAAFTQVCSNKLVIRHGNNDRAEQLLISEDADIGLSLEPGPGRTSPRIHYQSAYFVDFLAVAPKRHPFAKLTAPSLRDLVAYPLVVTNPGTHGREALENALYRERLEANIAVETDNSGFTIACVQAGMGVGILAGKPSGRLCRQLAARSLRDQLGHRKIVVMSRKGRQLTEPIQQLIQFIKKHHSESATI